MFVVMRDDPRRARWQTVVAHRWHYGDRMIRSLGLSLVAVASLVACTDTGAHLTLSAPDGPSNAKTFRVVLATPEQIPAIRNQRLAPGDPSTTDVSYFLQRTVAGGEGEAIDDVDGFTVRIAPDTALLESSFIPFVLIYDSGGRIEGIGTYRAGDAPPSAIRVATDVIDKYVVNVERTKEITDDAVELQPGELRVVTCYHDDQTSYPSGLAWHTREGKQYRLLFPNDGSLDATGRELDMDCDDHEVTAQSSHRDCDDTRSAYHRDAEDVCDGEDTNCDGAQTIASACDVELDCADPFSQRGVQLCNDTTQQETACHATAACTCTNAAGSAGCRFCTVPFETSIAMPSMQGTVHPCQPAIGTFDTKLCTEINKCDVEVVDVRGGWKVKISAPQSNAFGQRAYDVERFLAIQVERPEGSSYETQGTGLMPVADIDLAFITAAGTYYVGIELKLDESAEACPVAPAPAMLTCY